MERVIVALEPGKTSIWAVVHGLNLAKRIRARIYILIVSGQAKTEGAEKRLRFELEEEIESLIEDTRSEGIPVELYVAYGQYDQEVVRFIRDNKTGLLILGVPLPGKGESKTRFFEMVEKIRRRVDCRIEIVNEKGVKIDKRRSE